MCVCESMSVCVSTPCTGDEVKVYSFLNLAPVQHDWSISHSAPLPPGKNIKILIGIQYEAGWAPGRSEYFLKKKIFALL